MFPLSSHFHLFAAYTMILLLLHNYLVSSLCIRPPCGAQICVPSLVNVYSNYMVPISSARGRVSLSPATNRSPQVCLLNRKMLRVEKVPEYDFLGLEPCTFQIKRNNDILSKWIYEQL